MFTKYQDRETNWLYLNAYGVLIGLLEIVSAITAFATPGYTILGRTAYIGYLIGGIVLIWSYVTVRTDFEVFASVGLIFSNLLHFFHEWRTEEEFPTRSAAIALIVIICVTMRILALIRGGTYIVPTWDRGER